MKTIAKKRLATAVSACTLSLALALSASSSFAASHEEGDHEKGGGHGMGGQSNGQMESGHKAGSSLKGLRQGRQDIMDLLAEEDDGEDSDRPEWAGQSGNEGKPGGGNSGSDRLKGDDYGDIVILLRNDDGTVYHPNDDESLSVAILSDGSQIELINGELPEGTILPEGVTLQEVEFGRLNVARSPTTVIYHSLTEALSKLDGGVLGEDVTLDESGRLVVDGVTIDSPLENLALYEALLTAPTSDVDGVTVVTLTATASSDGQDTTYSFTVPQDAVLELAASALAAASDKTGDLTIDEVVGITGFLGEDVLSALENYVTDGSIDDYSAATTYDDVQVYIMVGADTDDDGILDTWTRELVDIMDVVDFSAVDTSSIFENSDGGIDIFTQMADDAVQVLEYVHDNAISE
ncbi:hypothetical protein ACQUQP_14870 [Marinobacterium sp. YM272]|uniref:hypothetical protein n=1 Tax=Marinobacterium sp. YM272 TaxID=3421654 RepID=UPI003D7F7D5E